MITLLSKIWVINKSILEKTELCESLEAELEELKAEINGHVVKSKHSENEIVELNKRRDLAKTEILHLNTKIEMLSSMITSTDTSKSHELENINDEKIQELSNKIQKLEKTLTHNSNLLIRVNKSIVDVYKDFINLLIQAEESNSKSKNIAHSIN